MAEVINSNDSTEAALEVERTEDFYSAANDLSECLSKLTLTSSENNGLIGFILKQIETAEQGAFNHGFRMGVKFGEWNSKNKECSNGSTAER